MNPPFSSDAEAAYRGQSPVHSQVPPAAEWSPVAVRLLQGVVYNDDHLDHWEMLLKSVSPLTDYFAKLGLLLVVDEADGMAFLRQYDEEETPSEYESIPKLFRRSPLSFDASLLCVLLRDELRQFEEEDVQNERCVISQTELFSVWQAFHPEGTDEVRLNRSLTSSLRKLEELKFVRQFEKDPPSWEVRRIVKARLPLDDLERLRASLLDALGSEGMKENVGQPIEDGESPEK